MAHGQSNQFRRAGWLVAVCGLTAAIGCHGPEKDDPVKRLDPSTRQQLLGLSPAKPGSANAALDQRFNRTTPVNLPAPELGSTPPAPTPAPSVGATTPPPAPNPVGVVSAPTKPINPASFGGPQPVHYTPPTPAHIEPVIQQTGGVGPKMPNLIPNEGGMPDMGAVAPIAPPPPPPAPPSPPVAPVTPKPLPSSDLSQMPLPTVPALPTLDALPPPSAPPAQPLSPPLPGLRDSRYPPVQSPTEAPPFVK